MSEATQRFLLCIMQFSENKLSGVNFPPEHEKLVDSPTQ
jgi:hypothetical protein